MYKVAFFDIDGTLYNTKKQLPQTTIDAVHRLMMKGIEPVIATGRGPFNVIRSDISKASGIEAVLHRLGISRAEAIAFGDGPNDVEMLSYVGMGVAMGNASDEVKAHADFVTRSVDKDGIAYALRKLAFI